MSKPTHAHAPQPARHHINVLGQVLKFIPRSIISNAAKETGVGLKARTYSVLSHLGTMIFAQLAHALPTASKAGTQKSSLEVIARPWRRLWEFDFWARIGD